VVFDYPLEVVVSENDKGLFVVVGFSVALTLITSLRCLFLEFDEEPSPTNIPTMVLIIKRLAD